MGKWIYTNEDFDGLTTTQGATLYASLMGEIFSSTEANAQHRLHGSYIARRLWCNVTNIDGTCTLTDRKNGGAGGQSISITTTGEKEDLTGATALVDDDLYNLQAVMSNSHGNTCTFHCASILLDDLNTNIPVIFRSSFVGASFSNAADVGTLGGVGKIQGTLVSDFITRTSSGVFSNFTLWFFSNSFNVATTYNLRKNSANANQVVSLGSGVTGELEDSVNTDIVTSGIRWAYRKPGAGSIGDVSVSPRGSLKYSGKAHYLLSTTDLTIGVDFSSSGVFYSPINSVLLSAVGPEANVRTKTRVAAKFANLQSNISANTKPATVIDFRVNGSSPASGPSILVASGTTGLREDLDGSYTALPTDLINFRVFASGTDGTITIKTIGIEQLIPESSDTCNLFMTGHALSSGSCNLYTINTGNISGTCDLFINGLEFSSGTCNLHTISIGNVSGAIDLSISGVAATPSESNEMDLFIEGEPSNQITLSISGSPTVFGNRLYYSKSSRIYRSDMDYQREEILPLPITYSMFSFGGIVHTTIRVDTVEGRIFYNLSSVIRSAKLDGTDVINYGINFTVFDLDKKQRRIYGIANDSGITSITYEGINSNNRYLPQNVFTNGWLAVNSNTQKIYVGAFSGITQFIAQMDYNGDNYAIIDAGTQCLVTDPTKQKLFASNILGISGINTDINTIYPIKFDANFKLGFGIDSQSGLLYYVDRDADTFKRISYSGINDQTLGSANSIVGMTSAIDASTGSCGLFITNFETQLSDSLDLHMFGVEFSSGIVPLSIFGQDIYSSGLDLSISGSMISGTYMDTQNNIGPRQSGIYGAGDNIGRQFGIATLFGTGADIDIPRRLDTISSSGNIVQMAGGGFHALYLYGNGTIFSAGANSQGECGQSGIADPAHPGFMKYDQDRDAILSRDAIFASGIKIACGEDHSLVLDPSGTVWACGRGTSGRLGIGTTTNRTWLVPSFSGINFNIPFRAVDIAAGNGFSLVLDEFGRVWTCGLDDQRQQGHDFGNQIDWRLNTELSGAYPATAIVAGDVNSYVKTSVSGWLACGVGTNGALGNGTTPTNSLFVKVSGLDDKDISELVAGIQFATIRTSSGTVYSWGLGTDGRLGTGSATTELYPRQISGILPSVIDIAASDRNGYAISSDNIIYSWGDDSESQLGNGGGVGADALSPVLVASGAKFDFLQVNNKGDYFLVFTQSIYDSSPPLYISGSAPSSSGNMPLFINGFDITSGLIPLYMVGHEISNSGIDLAISGIGFISGAMTLVFAGNSSESGIDLFINGNELYSSGLNLFEHGHGFSSGICDLFIKGTASGTIPLFISGIFGNDIDLFINGHQVASGAIDLFTKGIEKGTFVGFVKVDDNLEIDSFSLFMHGAASGVSGINSTGGTFDLFISNDGGLNTGSGTFAGLVHTTSGILQFPSSGVFGGFVKVGNNPNNNFELFVKGHTGSIPAGIDSSGNISLVIIGDGDIGADGFIPISGLGAGFVRVKTGALNSFNLFLMNNQALSGIDLYTFGIISGINNNMGLFSNGLLTESGQVPIIIHGISGSISNSSNLFLLGNPTGLQSSIINLYQHGF